MSSNVHVHLKDKVEIRDFSSLNGNIEIQNRISGAPKRTKVTLINSETGEILDVRENKVVITGGQLNAMRAFGLEPTVLFPTYNSEMKLDNSSDPAAEAKNPPVVCLFCVSDSGCGSLSKDVFVTNYTDRIKPAPADPHSIDEFTSDMIMPFRYVDDTADLNEDLRKYYFGRKTFDRLGKIGYYFKKFDTEPQLHLRYADGTQITENIYENESDQMAECYVEMRLRITRLDFRDYFEDVLGWDKARISSLSLCFAWYDDEIDDFVYYQDITPYTVLNHSFINLADATIAVDVLYDIYY